MDFQSRAAAVCPSLPINSHHRYTKGKTPRLTQPATRPDAHNNSLAKKQQLANTTIVYQRLIHVDRPTDLSQNYPKRDLAKHPQPHPHIRLRHMC